MSVEEQRESALAYMNIQARTGQLQSKNTQQLIAESAAFAKELDLSAQLMGTSRKAQQEAQEAALTETRFRAALIDAEQRGDKEKMDLLRQAQKAAAMVRATGDERGARGILQGAAGGLTTQESIAAEQTYNVQRILAQGSNLSDAEMARQLAESAKTMLGLTAGVSAFVGQIDTMQTSITGMDDFVKRIGAISEAAAKQNLSIDDFLKSEQGQRMAQGGDTKAMTEAGRAQQAAAMLQDSVVKTYNAAAAINKLASETFRDAVSVFSRTVHAKPVTGGTPGSPTGTTSAAPEQGFWSSLWNGPSGPRRGQVKSLASGATTGEQQLLDLIGQGESRGNYNALVYGNKGTPGSADLTNMTIAQVQEYQRGMIGRGHASTAVGKYQMIEKTLAEQVKKAGLDPTTTKFDQKTQDLLARQLIQQAGYGKKDTATVMYNLAGTWASLPQDMSGRGRYDGYNRNQSVINPQDLHAALVAPASGYRTQTPTASAVISPVDQTPAQAVAADQSAQLAQRMAMLESQSNNSSNIRIAQIAEALLDRLDRLVDVASDQLGVSNKILKSRS
jgi:muramidase (phage lysozyme)